VIASGGRAAWDNTDYLQWRFFGNRLHTWNKSNGDLIISSDRDSSFFDINLETMEGMVILKGDTLGPLESKDAYIQRGKEYWINDSYWIFLPFKLKDSGVTLKYLGEGATSDGTPSEKLELTFKEVGVSPDNKYIVYVDKATNLINQWDFYSKYDDEEAAFSSPWSDYKDYNGLMLASSRGDGRGMQDIEVGESLASKWEKWRD